MLARAKKSRDIRDVKIYIQLEFTEIAHPESTFTEKNYYFTILEQLILICYLESSEKLVIKLPISQFLIVNAYLIKTSL